MDESNPCPNIWVYYRRCKVMFTLLHFKLILNSFSLSNVVLKLFKSFHGSELWMRRRMTKISMFSRRRRRNFAPVVNWYCIAKLLCRLLAHRAYSFKEGTSFGANRSTKVVTFLRTAAPLNADKKQLEPRDTLIVSLISLMTHISTGCRQRPAPNNAFLSAAPSHRCRCKCVVRILWSGRMKGRLNIRRLFTRCWRFKAGVTIPLNRCSDFAVKNVVRHCWDRAPCLSKNI